MWKLGNHAYDVSAVFTVNDYLHLRAGALAGNFVTELPAFIAAEYIKNGALIELLPECIPLCIWYTRNSGISLQRPEPTLTSVQHTSLCHPNDAAFRLTLAPE